jgi:hypothetical protein
MACPSSTSTPPESGSGVGCTAGVDGEVLVDASEHAVAKGEA